MVLVMQMYWLVFIDSVDDLRSKVVVETHGHLVNVERYSVVWIHLRAAVSLCVWPTHKSVVLCAVFPEYTKQGALSLRPHFRWHISKTESFRRNAVRSYTWLVLPHRTALLHTSILLLASQALSPHAFLFVCVCVWVTSADSGCVPYICVT